MYNVVKRDAFQREIDGIQMRRWDVQRILLENGFNGKHSIEMPA